MKTNEMKKEKGITLIALIVTIIVLLILASVSIAVLTGENGILNRATEAKQTNEQKTAEEELKLGIASLSTDYYSKTTRPSTFREFIFTEESEADLNKYLSGTATFDDTNYTITYKNILYEVAENGGIWQFELIALTGFNIKETAIEVQQGRTKQLTIENKTPNDANEQIVWESSNTEVATVDENGVVTGKTTGSTTATITATSSSGGATSSTSCVVTVTEATSEIPEGANAGRYGGYVQNYGINLGIGADETSAADDWKVFYDDGTNIYIIAADYVPNTNQTLQLSVANMGASTWNPYCVYGNGSIKTYQEKNNVKDFYTANGAADIFSGIQEGTKTLIEKGFLGFWKKKTTTSTKGNAKMTASLMDTKVWEGFADGIPRSVLSTLPNDNRTAYAIGGPTLSMFVESWNKKKTTQLYYNNATSLGYGLGTSAKPSGRSVNLSSNSDYTSIKRADSSYTGDLYFPHTEKRGYSDCAGYWLASPAIDNDTIQYRVKYDGEICEEYYWDNQWGVRPVVCLPSSVTLQETAQGSGAYNIVKKQ